jgi:hypothetical protein
VAAVALVMNQTAECILLVVLAVFILWALWRL